MNAYEIYNNISDDGIYGNAPVTNNRLKWDNPFYNNPFDKIKESNAIEFAKANAQMLLEQNRYKYFHDEAIANTAVQRRVADLLKAGLNPYLANSLFGGNNGFGGEVPQAAAMASSGEQKQKLDWRTFLAQSGMSMLQQIMSATMSGFSIYQTHKAIAKAKEDAKAKKDGKNVNLDPSYGEVIKENLANGAQGLRDGLMEMEKMLPALLGALFGKPNWNF